ncbi:Cytochrome c553 [Paenibacillus sp. 1_12]|uniref:S-layer homology domain-containing protein n=1 Tax=Paenibacillus sp. 1_12 TaxID=1566278 RepID=UPI0008EE0AAA|nr:S-layer homology domain-containing protein [Paenibacillus sp. 1_12]SFL49088.1 Cytochrome c553 [Paenibacillus sp. 1_12]
MKIFNPARFRFPLLLLGTSLIAGVLWVQDELRSDSTLQAASLPPAASVPANNGLLVYEQNCIACHAVEGKGLDHYPPLVGDHVKKKYGTYEQAYEFISRSMPQNSPGSLSEEDYKNVTRYILSLNGVPTEFNDISRHWASKEIKELFDKQLIDGYVNKQDGTMSFKPEQNITRVEFVRYLVKAKQMFLSNSTTSDFTDINTDKEDRTYIITAVEYGLIDGYADHTFRPNNQISRAEIAAILARGEMLKAAPGKSFSDVADNFWAKDNILAVQQAKLFDGYEDGTFRPLKEMKRGEAVAVIYRLLYPS